MPNIAGRDGQTVFPGDGGDLRVPQVAVLPPVLSLGCFQLGSVAAPFRRGSAIKIHKASSVKGSVQQNVMFPPDAQRVDY